MIIFLLTIFNHTTSIIASETSKRDMLSEQEKELTRKCNRAARDAFVYGDIKSVEDICIKAINEIEKSHPDDEYLVYPILKLAVSYSISSQGQYLDKATPLYERALKIRKHLYNPNSEPMKELQELMDMHEEAKKRYGK